MPKIRSFYPLLVRTCQPLRSVAPMALGAGLCLLIFLAIHVLYPAPAQVIAHVQIENPDPDLDTELKALRSPQLAMKVIHDLDLAHKPQFMQVSAHRWLPLREMVSSAVHALEPSQAHPFSETDAVQQWARNVHIAAHAETSVLDIAVKAASPELAKAIADTMAGLFVQQQANVQNEAAAAAENARIDLSRAEAARDTAYALAANHNAQTNQNDAQSLELLKARAEKVKELVAHGQIIDAADILDLPSLRALSDEQRKIKVELQINGKTLLDQHPVMKELNARLMVVDTRLRAAVVRAAQALDAELARQRVAVPAAPPVLAEFDQRVVDARQKLQDVLQNNTANAGKPISYRHILADDILNSAFSSVLLPYMLMICGGGAGIGFLFSLGMRRIYRQPAAISMPAQASLKPRALQPASVQGYSKPLKLEGKALSSPDLQTILQHIAGKNVPQVVLVHGFEPEIVKAELAALVQGKTVLMVDLDTKSSGRRRPGLGDLLSGEAHFEDVIYPQEAGFDFMPAGRQGVRRLGLGLVVATLSEAFDMIFLSGLDIHSTDLDMLRPCLTSVVFVDQPSHDEENWIIEAALDNEPECEMHSVKAQLPSILQNAA